MTQEDVGRFERVLARGGVGLFPADTVYGLGADPFAAHAVRRLYEIKRRESDKPAAVMFFDLDRALANIGELGERTRSALQRILPGAVTVVLPNPARLFPIASGPEPERLGLRVPRLAGSLEALAALPPVLQSSANRSGGADPRRLEDVDPAIRGAVDVELDGGELPGTPSTVVDLTAYEEAGAFEVLREGAVPIASLEGVL